MILRPASLKDAAPLSQLGEASFRAAFEHLYRPADLAAFLAGSYSENLLTDALADPSILYHVAAEGEALIGYCKLIDPSPYAAHSDAVDPIALGQLYTDPARTSEGIGAALMDWALAQARERCRDAIQLSVWSENMRAQQFYARYGFVKIADIDFWVGTHRDDEFLLERKL